MSSVVLSLAELRELVAGVLTVSHTSATNAGLVAEALIAAEADGIPSHGLSRVPFYADQAMSGKVDGHAEPHVWQPAPACLFVDARQGFARPAISAGAARGRELARQMGVATIAIGHSHHFGVAGFHVERIAEDGLIALACGNTPAAIAPWGGTTPLYGTDPIAFACPRRAKPPLVIDLSMSRVARGKIMLARKKGEPIPDDWAVDAAGRPTTDAAAALSGALLPIAGAKGAALALMVEILAAALTGSHFGFEASSFFDAAGPPPRVGQLFILLDPRLAGGEHFADRVECLLDAIAAQPGTRLPGDRRLTARADALAHGVHVSSDLPRRSARPPGTIGAFALVNVRAAQLDTPRCGRARRRGVE